MAAREGAILTRSLGNTRFGEVPGTEPAKEALTAGTKRAQDAGATRVEGQLVEDDPVRRCSRSPANGQRIRSDRGRQPGDLHTVRAPARLGRFGRVAPSAVRRTHRAHDRGWQGLNSNGIGAGSDRLCVRLPVVFVFEKFGKRTDRRAVSRNLWSLAGGLGGGWRCDR